MAAHSSVLAGESNGQRSLESLSTARRIAESQIRLKPLSTQAYIRIYEEYQPKLW